MFEYYQAKRALARRMRSAPTFHEEALWKLLCGRCLETLKFRRQTPLGRYVVDFLCLRHRLVVEADGPFHDPNRDAIRDAWLRGQGFSVLRFPNSAISNRPSEVIAAILSATRAPLTQEFDTPSDRWALDNGAPLPSAYLRAAGPDGG